MSFMVLETYITHTFLLFPFFLVQNHTVYYRWRPVAPTGVAHAVTQDDYYEGYFIPKGATVYANI